MCGWKNRECKQQNPTSSDQEVYLAAGCVRLCVVCSLVYIRVIASWHLAAFGV